MKLGIIGPGTIAQQIAFAASQTDGIECYAVASRDPGRASSFAEKWGFAQIFSSYEALIADPLVDLVYIATPHVFHYPCAKSCIKHGKNVLVEKPFTINASQAEELFALAKVNHVFITEAMWMRYLPSAKMLRDAIGSGVIGDPISIMANFAFDGTNVQRLQRLELGGGALMDAGVYPLHFACMLFSEEVTSIASSAILSSDGIDSSNGVILTFSSGRIAVLHSSIAGHSDWTASIYGTNGFIQVPSFFNCSEIRIFDADSRIVRTIEIPKQINGYEYELIDCMNSIAAGKSECDAMPHSETVSILKMTDRIRKDWGLRYPCENA